MLTFSRADGQSLQIGEITVTVLDIGEDEVLLRIDCPEDALVEPGNSELVLQSEWLLD